jgi:hypothetical protein
LVIVGGAVMVASSASSFVEELALSLELDEDSSEVVRVYLGFVDFPGLGTDVVVESPGISSSLFDLSFSAYGVATSDGRGVVKIADVSGVELVGLTFTGTLVLLLVEDVESPSTSSVTSASFSVAPAPLLRYRFPIMYVKIPHTLGKALGAASFSSALPVKAAPVGFVMTQ